MDDAKAVARAELDIARAKAAMKLGRYRSAAVLFGIAAVFGLVALMSLAVGTIAVLAQSMSPSFATLVAISGYGILAIVCAIIGKRFL